MSICFVGKVENEQELVSQTLAVIKSHFNTEKNYKPLDSKPEPLCASDGEMERFSCPLYTEKNSKENMKTTHKTCASVCSVKFCDEEKHVVLSERNTAVPNVNECVTNVKENSLQNDQSYIHSRNEELELVQEPRTKTEVTAASLLPTNERVQPVSDTDVDTAENIIIQRDTILEEEKIANNEFFMGRSLKTPERYEDTTNFEQNTLFLILFCT